MRTIKTYSKRVPFYKALIVRVTSYRRPAPTHARVNGNLTAFPLLFNSRSAVSAFEALQRANSSSEFQAIRETGSIQP